MTHQELIPMIPELALYSGIAISVIQGCMYSPVKKFSDAVWQVVYALQAGACVLGICVLHMTD